MYVFPYFHYGTLDRNFIPFQNQFCINPTTDQFYQESADQFYQERIIHEIEF